MKLRNKKTGEIIDSKELLTDEFIIDLFSKDFDYFNSKICKLQDEWEDYEEPKEYWFLSGGGDVLSIEDMNTVSDKEHKLIGNYFETREEAEKAVEKLKAAKLLKDMGFKIVGIRYRNNRSYIEWNISPKVRDDHFMAEAFYDALHLLFGGEDE